MKAVLFIGTQRSGSNLLRLMLNQMQGVAAPHPPHILSTFFPLLPLYGDLSNQHDYKRLVDDVCTFTELNPLDWKVKFDRECILEKTTTPSLIEIFRLIHEAYARQHQSHTWFCKSMSNAHYIPEIEQAGLKPVYIHLYRDGRDVAASFKKVVVGEKHAYFIAQQWSRDQQAALDFSRQYAADRTIMVRYEAMISEPEKVVSEICEKIGCRYETKALEFYRTEEAILLARRGSMYIHLKEPIHSDNKEKFLQFLTQKEILIFESVAGDMMERLSYKPIFSCSDRLDFSQDEIENFRKLNEADKIAIHKKYPDDIGNRVRQTVFIDKIKNKAWAGKT